MAVYIDNYKGKFGRMIMCHMFGDTLVELHKMAKNIGIKRQWFQNKGSAPHYDVCKSKRILAVKLGAIELNCSSKEWGEVYNRAKLLK